jgi:hypothetical protein
VKVVRDSIDVFNEIRLLDCSPQQILGVSVAGTGLGIQTNYRELLAAADEVFSTPFHVTRGRGSLATPLSLICGSRISAAWIQGRANKTLQS